MRSASHPRAAVSYLWNAIWTTASASGMAVVFLALLTTTDGSVELPEINHPDACHACASSTTEARAVRDTSLIGSGAFEGPTASVGLSE
jgi:hypothetical protein